MKKLFLDECFLNTATGCFFIRYSVLLPDGEETPGCSRKMPLVHELGLLLNRESYITVLSLAWTEDC